MDLEQIERTWTAVRTTPSRSAKIAALAETLVGLSADEIVPGTAMLAGEFHQGRIGIGWRTVGAIAVAPAATASLAVLDVDRAIDELVGISGSGSQARRRELLDALWTRATAGEQELLAGLMLGNLRQGALEGVVIQAVAAAADVDLGLLRRGVMLTGDVTRATVLAMTGGDAALAAIRLELMRPVQPMLAQSAADVAAALERTGPAHVETKLDGMRIQVHRDGDRIGVFTRSLRDVTGGLPGVVAAARSLPAERFILDGEALGVGADGRPLPFQETMQNVGDAGMRPWFFDVLHLDGTDLIDAPLADRREALSGFMPTELRVRGVATDNAEVALAHLRDSLARGHEGVVVKDDAATYEAGRRGASWVKVKVAHTLDLVVLAVEWGSGRREGWLSNLHLGAVNDVTGETVMLGKTFKGMTDEMLAWQTGRLLELETHREGHVVFVQPELIVEIAFDGVQASRRYAGGVALRFARIKRYRTDKTLSDVDTLQTVQAIQRGEIAPEV